MLDADSDSALGRLDGPVWLKADQRLHAPRQTDPRRLDGLLKRDISDADNSRRWPRKHTAHRSADAPTNYSVFDPSAHRCPTLQPPNQRSFAYPDHPENRPPIASRIRLAKVHATAKRISPNPLRPSEKP